MSRANAGAPWTPEQDRALLDAFHSHADVATLADTAGRTRAAVLTRLVHMGHLLHTPTGYYLPTLYCTFADAREPRPFRLADLPARGGA